MTFSVRTALPLDHLVLPVTSITVARDRLVQLGFTVAADARHPFGTENACVFFSDKSYLEPLGVASQEECVASAKAGNQFVVRDQVFRFRHGSEGLSAIVLGTTDADGDHIRFCGTGISAGDLLQFSRPMKLPDGSEITATFKLSFAADLRSPDFHGITCQRINVPKVDRSALEMHPNGVLGIKNVVLSEPDPEDFRDFLTAITGQDYVRVHSGGMEIKTPNATVSVFNPDGMMAVFGIKASCHTRGLRGRAVIFTVADLGKTEDLLKANEVEFTYRDQRLLVSHEVGQAVLFGFEE